MSAETPNEGDGQTMPLLAHLLELRRRVLYCAVGFLLAFIISFHYANVVYDFLARPLADAMQAKGHDNPRMIFTAVTEAFFTQLKLAMWVALMATLPFTLLQIWKFIAPGLYSNEQKAFRPFLVATPVLFYVGAAFAYWVVFPMAWKFFLSYETIGTAMAGAMPIQLEAKVNEYLSIVTGLILAFGFCFELPVLLVLLHRVGLVQAKTLGDGRRYALVGILIVAAIVTPPDILSQLMLAIPMYILYEIAVWLCYWQEKTMRRADSALPMDATP
jgi:sec-independent protein translocase protein TatC